MNLIVIIMAVAVAAIVLLWLAFKYILKMVAAPVMEISLEPEADPRWSDRARAEELSEWFLRNGFEPAGIFGCRQIPGLVVSGFVNGGDRTAGVLYDHPEAGIWIDLAARYEDGGGLTVSNAPLGGSLDSMPGREKHCLKGASPDELKKKFLQRARPHGRVAVASGEFASVMEEEYGKEMRWRADRGGPTPDEVAKIAAQMPERPDGEAVAKATGVIREAWEEERQKPRKKASDIPFAGALPAHFIRPEDFRREMAEMNRPVPQLGVPAAPVYIALFAAIAGWLMFGHRYNAANKPVSMTAMWTFIGVFGALCVAAAVFRLYRRSVMMCPRIRSVAEQRPGAFLFVSGWEPSICYAREDWIGILSFVEGNKHRKSATRLDALSRHSTGSMAISGRGFFGRMLGLKGGVEVPDGAGEFGVKFSVDTSDEAFSRSMLTHELTRAVTLLERFREPAVDMEGGRVFVEVSEKLGKPGREDDLKAFAEAAESIVEVIVRQSK